MKSIEKILKKNNVKNFGFCNFNLGDIDFKVRNSHILDETYKSIIMLTFPYYSEYITKGNISAYASVNDYHTVIKSKLKPIVKNLNKSFYGHKFQVFVDSSPIKEVNFATKCGLGVKGINSLLITRDFGSYVFLGSVITTLPLKIKNVKKHSCRECMLCVKNCPTSCIDIKNGVDKNRCLSHITQKKGELTENEKSLMKKNNTMWGCDVCQKVCPHNKGVKETYLNEFLNDIITSLNKDLILKTYKNRPYGWRGKDVLLRNLEVLEK